MRDAAQVLGTEGAMQIRYLETLNAISRNSGDKLLFIPVNHDQLNFESQDTYKQK